MISVNVVHPYTFKLRRSGGRFELAPTTSSHLERDQNVNLFLRCALERGEQVVEHQDTQGDENSRDEVLRSDPLYGGLFDPRVVHVTTAENGLPRVDTRPLGIPRSYWAVAQSVYTSHSDLRRLIGEPDGILVFGGLLESCLGNMCAYFCRSYGFPAEKVHYLSDLCVSFDPSGAEVMRRELTRIGILGITSEQGLELMKK